MNSTGADLERTAVGAAGLALLGSPNGRLLAGPAGPEDLRSHRGRLGAVTPDRTPADGIFDMISAAALRGRGGGYFLLAEKMAAARRLQGPAVVVVNATESEPASGKDRHLMLNRPHLIIDGAQAVAVSVRADRVILAAHAGPAFESLRVAVRERCGDPATTALVPVPDRYVAGESSALVSWINGGSPLPPGRRVATAVSGVDGRPTVVGNAETFCHAALIVAHGPEWFRQVGPSGSPGSLLVTITGDVVSPGRILEVVGGVSVGQAVEAAEGATDRPSAVLIGGYAGRWQPAEAVWDLPIDPAILSRSGSPIGCGLIGVVGCARCGLTEAARLTAWLSSQRAGQCGACDAGLPELAAAMADATRGTAGAGRAARRIAVIGDAVGGRNLCHLPDGAVAMVESAVTTFWDEMRLHRKHRCSGRTDEALFPTPMKRSGLDI